MLRLSLIKHIIFFQEKPKREFYEKDVLECLSLCKNIQENKTILDIGSGGGFPGIILSITKPKNKISLVESSNKKCYFLRKIKHDLSLENTNIINQTISKNNNIGLFDIITARAFASTQKILELTENNTHKNKISFNERKKNNNKQRTKRY